MKLTMEWFDSLAYGYDLEFVIKQSVDSITKEELETFERLVWNEYGDLLIRDSRLDVTKDEMGLATIVRDKYNTLKNMVKNFEVYINDKKEYERHIMDLTSLLDTANNLVDEYLQKDK